MSDGGKLDAVLRSIDGEPPFHFEAEFALSEFGFLPPEDVDAFARFVSLEDLEDPSRNYSRDVQAIDYFDFDIEGTEPGANREKDFSEAPPPWLVGFSREFRKDIDNMDRKMRDRVFDAILLLSAKALEAKGDTVKKLKGDFYKDCWRVRLGDFRLVFRAVPSEAQLTLLCFAARGDVYAD